MSLYAQHPELKYYGPSQSGVGGSFWQIEQSKTGKLFAATHEGIAVFDGTKWKLMSTRNEAPVYSISKESNCRFYVGGQEELGYVEFDENNQIKYHSLYNLLPKNIGNIGKIWKTTLHNNLVYFQSEKMLLIWNKSSFKIIYPENNSFFFSHVLGHELWLQEEGIGLYNINGFSKKFIQNSGIFNNMGIYQILNINKKQKMILSNERGLERYIYEDNSIQKLDDPNIKVSALIQEIGIYSAKILKDLSILIGLKNGTILKLNENFEIIDSINSSNSILKGEIRNLFEDESNYIWASTSNGLYQIDYNPSFNAYPADVFKGDFLQNITERKNKIIGHTTYHLYEYYNNSFREFYSSNEVIYDIENIDESRFLLLKNNQLAVFNDEIESSIQINDFFQIEPFLFKDQFIICSPHQIILVQVNNNNIDILNGKIIEDTEIKKILIDKEGKIWFTTLDRGIGVWYQDELKYFGFKEGLRPELRNRIFKYKNQVLVCNEEGIFALLYSKNRVSISRNLSDFFNENKLKLINLLEIPKGLIAVVKENTRYKIIQAEEENGLLKIKNTNLELLESNGLKRMFLINKNNIFFSYNEQLVIYNASSTLENKKLYPISFEKILYPTKGEVDYSDKSINVDYSNGDLVFKFNSPHYYFYNDIQYHYRLKNYNNEFTISQEANKVVYGNLKEGKYIFEVFAQDKFGNSSEISTLTIKIHAPWYRAIWFRTFVLIIIITLILLIFKWRNDYLVKRNLALEAVVQQRTKELEEEKKELIESKEELFELGKQKNNLLGIAAHDLKNPLSAIDGINSLLTQSIDLESDIPESIKSEYKEYLGMIEKSSSQMKHIIEDILNSVKLDKDKQNIALKAQSLISLLDEHYLLLNNYAKQKNILVKRDYSSDVIVKIDERKMGEVIQNLLSNAIKYSKERTEVLLSTQKIQVKEKEYIRISIKDQGPGFTEEDKSKMFQMFQRLSAKPTKGESSTGLGLYIVKNYTELNKGFVELDSIYGEGSTFHVYLPIDS